VSWVQAQLLARLLDDDTEGDWRTCWVRFAQTVTVRRLAETVERACLFRDTHPRGLAEHADDPEWFTDSERDEARGDRQTCARPRDLLGGVRLEIWAPTDVVRLFRALLCTVRRAIERETGHLPPESVAFEAMLDHALECWRVDDRWLRRKIGRNRCAVLERDDWRCVFPGCSSRRNLQVHHIVFRSAGGSDDPSNLTTLCAFHHQRGVHDGTVAVRGRAPDALEFEQGLRPGREPLARFRSGDRKAPLGSDHR